MSDTDKRAESIRYQLSYFEEKAKSYSENGPWWLPRHIILDLIWYIRYMERTQLEKEMAKIFEEYQ